MTAARTPSPRTTPPGEHELVHQDLTGQGTPGDFVRGSADLVRGIAPSAALPGPTGESLVLGGASVAPGALLLGGTVVGRGVVVGAGARLDGAVLFDGAEVEPGATVERSIVGFGARIGARALVRDAVIGDGAVVGARCELLCGARVWPGVGAARRRHPVLHRRVSAGVNRAWERA